jgi:hypothetical protein
VISLHAGEALSRIWRYSTVGRQAYRKRAERRIKRRVNWREVQA